MPKVKGRSGQVHNFTGVYLKDGKNVLGPGKNLDRQKMAGLFDIYKSRITESHILSGYSKIVDTMGEQSYGCYELIGPDATDEAKRLAVFYGFTLTTPRQPRLQ